MPSRSAMETMSAYVLHGPRDLRLEDVPRPDPGPGEVLVQVRAAGICGSDLHYYRHGRCGNFVPGRPFVLGHECAGVVLELGEGVPGPAPGTRVAVDPSQPCGCCRWCREGRSNLCPEMVYFGSASVDPPCDGCFAECVVVPARNCMVLPEGFALSWAAMLEPMSVATHAVRRSGGVAGRPVLITGGGTMGQAILLVALAFGAGRVLVSDPRPSARRFAGQHGATAVLDPVSPDWKAQSEALAPDGWEVVFEASGAPSALAMGIELSARGATIVQVGTLPDGVEVPANQILTRELQYVGSWRFANVFERVIDLVVTGRIDLRSLITHTFPFSQLPEAIATADDGEDVIKVQVALQP